MTGDQSRALYWQLPAGLRGDVIQSVLEKGRVLQERHIYENPKTAGVGHIFVNRWVFRCVLRKKAEGHYLSIFASLCDMILILYLELLYERLSR